MKVTLEPIRVYYAYANKDKKLLDRLEISLKYLQRKGIIEHKDQIIAGDDRTSEAQKQLNAAQVILLLISPDFIASDYCYSSELQSAMQRHEIGKARVIPILLRPCEWQNTPIGKLKALPMNDKPITKWSNRDEAFVDIAKGIREAIKIIEAKWLKDAIKPVQPTARTHLTAVLHVWNVPYRCNRKRE